MNLFDIRILFLRVVRVGPPLAPTSFVAGCRIGRVDVQRREKEFDENPLPCKSIHFSEREGGRGNRALLAEQKTRSFLENPPHI